MKRNALTPTTTMGTWCPTWCPPSPEYGRGELGNPHLAARRARKAALLPRAAALAGAGRSYEEIAATLGIAKSTVCDWLHDRPLGRAAARSLGTPRMTARLAARYESLYQRAVREFNRSRTDRRTESVVTTTPGSAAADASPTIKTTVRTEPRIGSAACLGKALAALQAMEGLHGRERARRERLKELASDAAAGNAGGVTRTVKTTTTPAGRKVRTVVTTRSGLAALQDLQEALNGDADTGSARSANGSTAGTPGDIRKSFPANDLPLSECDFASVRRAATLANEVLQKRGAGTSRDAEGASVAGASGSVGDSLAGASGSDNASGSDGQRVAGAAGCDGAGAVNGGPANKRQDWRKSFVPKDLRLQPDELFGVSRSATLPNEVLQKRGRGKGKNNRRKAGGRRSAGAPPAQSGPPLGTAGSLARELDLALGGKGMLPAAMGDPPSLDRNMESRNMKFGE